MVVSSLTPTLTSRSVSVSIKRVSSLAEEARAFERHGIVGYDRIAKDIGGSVGMPTAVAGDVIESRGSAHRTLVLLDDKRECDKGPCVVRLVLGREVSIPRGALLR